ncbi:MAG TPA: hypothetical protein VKE30_02750 [Chthoniobacterales bacterium]|nr:hypothetical protein [Chthoniobacterales bacterium]
MKGTQRVRSIERFYENQLFDGIEPAVLERVAPKAIVEAHGGKISVRSVAGKGTTVDIRLPRPSSE